MPERLGWILVHSSKVYGKTKDYETPQAELKADYFPGMPWHWKLPRPLNEDGPYTLLFAWKGEIFGEATADVTHQIETSETMDYNFAFKLNDYEQQKKTVTLADLKIRPCHSLVVLTPQILQAYRSKLAAAERSR